MKQELKIEQTNTKIHNILSQCCSDDYHMTLSGEETKLNQILMIISGISHYPGHVMTLTEFICTEGMENGLGFHDTVRVAYNEPLSDQKFCS